MGRRENEAATQGKLEKKVCRGGDEGMNQGKNQKREQKKRNQTKKNTRQYRGKDSSLTLRMTG